MSWSEFGGIAIAELIAVAIGAAVAGLVWLVRRLYKRERRPASPTRRPVPHPLRPGGIVNPEEFHRAVEASGRIPLEHPPFADGFIGGLKLMMRAISSRNTGPKHAFGITGWEYTRNPDSPEHALRPGFILSFALHESENRRHFRYTLSPRNRRIGARVHLAIASARDMANPHAWVRCLVVDADNLNLPKSKPGCVDVQSLSPGFGEEPVVYCVPQKDVPLHALWLITTNPNHTVPSLTWGETPESLAASAAHAGDNHPMNCEGPIKALRRRFLGAKWALVLLFGPILGFFLIGLAVLWEFTLSTRTPPLVVAYIGMAWLVPAVILVLTALSSDLSSLTARLWCRREGQKRKDWKGGTLDCLAFGSVLGGTGPPSPHRF